VREIGGVGIVHITPLQCGERQRIAGLRREEEVQPVPELMQVTGARIADDSDELIPQSVEVRGEAADLRVCRREDADADPHGFSVETITPARCGPATR
jgi:hypothetical protein